MRFMLWVNSYGVFMFTKTQVTASNSNNNSGRYGSRRLTDKNYFTQYFDFPFLIDCEGLSVLKEV